MLHRHVTTPSVIGLRTPILWMLVVALMTVYGASVFAVRRGAVTFQTMPRRPDAPDVSAVRQLLRRQEPQTIETQIALCQVAAPPFGEAARGRAIAALFRDAGLTGVRIDEAGNVLGDHPGRGDSPQVPHEGNRGGDSPHVVVSAHLDTVFPPGTDVTVHRQGSTLIGPGIGDDCRGLAVLVALARVFGAGIVRSDGPVTFVATVGEEGLGDLRGARYLLDHVPGIDRFISIDGGGLSIVSRAVGSHRYKVTFSGPGGHSYGNFGMANPIHALGRAVGLIADLRVPAEPRTTFNVGTIAGGTSVNAIAAKAWMEVDLRSSDGRALDDLDRGFREAVDRAVFDENERWGGRSPVASTIERTGTRPTGRTPDSDSLVLAALAITRSLGESVTLTEGSTDANIAMSRGIPAVTIGGGGTGHGPHAPEESYSTIGSATGTERALLLVLAAASGSP